MAPRFPERRWLVHLIARFVLFYAVLMFLSVRLPLFETAEVLTVAVVDAGLRLSSTETNGRSIALVDGEESPRYRVEVRSDGKSKVTFHPYHPHAYILALFVAIVLATPALGRRLRIQALLGGALVLFLFSVGLLASDLAAWTAESDLTLQPAAWSPLGLLGGLHRTSGAGLLPVLTWVIVAAELSRRGSREETPLQVESA